MFTSNHSKRVRAMTVAGGIALIGTTGAGLAGTANAATSSGATSTLAKIKYCESGGNYQAVNSSSGASGAYQFLNSTWQGLSATKGYATAASAPASVQDAAALELYTQAGTSPWVSSSGCWTSMTSAPTSSSTSTTAANSTSSGQTTASKATSTTTPKTVVSTSVTSSKTRTSTTALTTAGSTTRTPDKPRPSTAVKTPSQAGHRTAPAHAAAHLKSATHGQQTANKQRSTTPHAKRAKTPVGSVSHRADRHTVKPVMPKISHKPANTLPKAA